MVNLFLENNFSPERRVLIHNAIEVLAKFNSVDIINELENIITADNEISNLDMIAMSNATVVDALLDILNAHGVVVLDLTRDLALLTNMADTLKLVVEDYDPSYIMDAVDLVLTEQNDALDVWVALVVLLTDSYDHDVITGIFDIEDTIIENIATNLANRNVELPPDDNSIYVTRYRKFLNGRRTGVVYDLVLGGIKLGTIDFNSIFLIIDDALYDASRKDQIFEVLSLLMICDDDPTTFSTTLESISRVLTNDEFAARTFLNEAKEEYLKQSGESL